jgi:hypothetical protein
LLLFGAIRNPRWPTWRLIGWHKFIIFSSTTACEVTRSVGNIPRGSVVRRIWRYQRGNQNPYVEEQTTQWPNKKVQKDKQRSTKHTHKTKNRVTRTPLKTGDDRRCSGRVNSSCFTSGTLRATFVAIRNSRWTHCPRIDSNTV